MTPTQLSAIRAVIDADPALSARPQTDDDAFFIAGALNQPADPDFMVWQTSTPTQNVFDAINWANMTPADAPDTTATWTNRALACQGKQFNLQTLLQGRESINSSKASIRAGLQDALTNLPSGAAGASRSGGWPAVQAAMQRKATRAEKALSTGTGSSASPAVMGYEGWITYIDVLAARAL